MKLFKTIATSGKESYINLEYLISLEPNENSGTAITVQGAMTRTYWDVRPISDVVKLVLEANRLQ